MKKIIILSLLMLCISPDSFSQTEKGRVMLSGKTDLRILFGKSKPLQTDAPFNDEIASSDFGASLGVSYFVVNGLALGIKGDFTRSYLKQQESIGAHPGDNNALYKEYLSNTVMLIPTAIYFIQTPGKIKPTVGIGAGYVSLREESIISGTKEMTRLSGLSLNGNAGVSYFVNKSISFDLNGIYTYNQLKDKIGTNNQNQNIAGVMAGISVYF